MLYRYVFVFLCMSFSANAHQPERGKLYAAFGPYFYQTEQQRSYPGVKSDKQVGAGLIVNGDIDKNGSLEIGMFYLDKIYFRKFNGLAVKEQVQRVDILLGYRHWFNSKFSFAGSFFSSYLAGDPEILYTEFATEAETPPTSAMDTVEYGLDLSLQWEFWQKEDYALFIDYRYSLSNTARSGEDGNHRAIFIAYKQQLEVR